MSLEEAGIDDLTLESYQLATESGEVYTLSVEGDKLVLDGSKGLTLDSIKRMAQPGTPIRSSAPSLEAINVEYDDMGWELSLGDGEFTVKGFRTKEGRYGVGRCYMIIFDSGGQPCGEFFVDELLPEFFARFGE